MVSARAVLIKPGAEGRLGRADLPPILAARYGLVAAWGCDDLADAYGSSTLTNNGGATFSAGKLGNAVYLNWATPQWLSLAGDPALGNVDFLVAAWAWLDATTGIQTAISKANSAGTQFAYALYYSAGLWRFYVEHFSDNSEARATTFGAATVGTWQLVIGAHDAVSDLILISVNGGAWDSAAHTAGARQDSFLAVGIGASGTAGIEPLGGRIDAVYYFKSPPGGIASLKDEIRDWLWNGGVGREYADWQPAGTGTPTAVGEMDRPGATGTLAIG